MNNQIGMEAVYKEQCIAEYRNNPMIEALPAIKSKEEVINDICVYPLFQEEEKKLDSHLKLHVIQRIFKYFQPLPMHLDLESRLSRMIRQGYINRNPLSKEYVEALNYGYRDIIKGDISNSELFNTTASGFSLIGVSGMGKTTALNRILSSFPQVILHKEYRGIPICMTQLVWLKIDCPYDGSLKALCLEFFLKIDNLLGTEYFKKYSNARLSANAMLPLMGQIAKITNLGILIVDEIQHLNLAKSGGAEKMLNYFVTLINTIGVPVVLVGTPKALGVLQSEFRQARRGSGQGDMIWDRLKKDEQFILLLEGLWDYQWTAEKIELNQNFIDIIYEESQGIIDIAIKLFVMAQVRAISSRKEKISVALIRQVAKENLRLVRPMLKALSTGNLKNISSFDDIMVVDVDNFMSSEKRKIDSNLKIEEFKRAKCRASEECKINIKEKAFIKLLELGFKDNEIERYLNEVIKTGEQDVGKIVRVTIELILGATDKNNSNKNKRKVKKTFSECDIRYIANKAKENNVSIYQKLKEANYIRSFDDIMKGVI
ncbi:MAG: ATP-binding protein [Clostridium sp.]|uniref:ATP-binding protein n=1 Tax=Clostridium sp. TaxID=1506 RepID=UPI002A90D869|nr:ATP-binding protein [Clostridium sp.]MDY6228056.1 ATP-binding protein [Clostridium sp.]